MMLRLLPFICALCLTFSAMAQDIKHELYSYPTAGGMRVGAVFGVLPDVEEDDTLLSATTPICGHVEIHTMSEDNGIFRMRKIEKLSVKAGEKNRLEPSGHHLMLMNLKSPLNIKEPFMLTLVFEKSGERMVTVPVINRGKK